MSAIGFVSEHQAEAEALSASAANPAPRHGRGYVSSDDKPAIYTLDRELAQGGMAALYLGHRIARNGFARPVALKRLRPELSQNPAAVALFLREACLGATLEHPGIVRVLDLTEIEGVLYLVMEYVHGGDLRLVLRRVRRRNQQFTPAAALYIGRELCAALEYAHGRCRPDGTPEGLIHRDVSPTNILLSVNGEVKLTDFGIAHADGATNGGPRARGQVGYMSPEQARGEPLDVRSDLFSLAAVLYEVSTGRRLFVGQVGQSEEEIYGAGVTPPSEICPNLPWDFDALLLRALALSATDRPPSARMMYEELLEVSHNHRLWMDRAEFTDHLLELCGSEPAAWATLEERTATALIASITAEEVAEHEEPESGLAMHAAQMAMEAAMEAMSQAPASSGLPELSLLSGPSDSLAPTPDEPFEPAITMPWPTVSVSVPPYLESDDTQPLPSAESPPESLPDNLPDNLPEVAAPARFMTSDDLDLDAVTGPAKRTAPSSVVEFIAPSAAAAADPGPAPEQATNPRNIPAPSLHEEGTRDLAISRNYCVRILLAGVLIGVVLSVLGFMLLEFIRHGA